MRFSANKSLRGRLAAVVLSASLLASCGAARIEAARVLSAQTPPGRTAPRHTAKHHGKPVCGPRCVAYARRVTIAQYLQAIWDSTHGPSRWGAPQPVSGMVCPPGPVHDLIDQTFTIAAPWFQSVAWRESGCQPAARNGSSGSAGIGQLLGHDDLLALVCPLVPPSQSWADYRCNIEASWRLFQGSGTAPWKL